MNWLSRMFTVPATERAKINQAIGNNPELLFLFNLVKSAAVGAAISAVTEHISDPDAKTQAAVAIATAVERAIPTPHSDPPVVNSLPATAPLSPLGP
jgi:hypothetical protein